jgi:hypothetical protein
MASRIVSEEARRAGLPISLTKSQALPAGYLDLPGLRRILLNPNHPMFEGVPGATPEAVQHELSEHRYRSGGRVFRVPLGGKAEPNAVSASKSTPWVNVAKSLVPFSPWRQGTKEVAKGKVMHFDPRVLLDESHRLASSQASPDMVERMTQLRRGTGEVEALHRLGIAYGKTLLPPGGRVYQNALQRFQESAAVPGEKQMYNLTRIMANHPRALSKPSPVFDATTRGGRVLQTSLGSRVYKNPLQRFRELNSVMAKFRAARGKG